ncbi:MAG: AAA domain-containing protein [Christensenellales bacterium]
MNQQEALFFEALSKERAEIADMLERPAVRGYKDSVVEKYSDQAHFIYELLQNADDACATNARFILEANRLIFAHNGSRYFSVSNPANEDADSKNKTLGDINAITSIANSNKDEASIGKFGVGFKSVFQYTSTPHIYDPGFKFKIERFIVPVSLDSDFPGRCEDETLFVFPFNHQERDAEEAYNDISDKLNNLTFPLLFLTNLKRIKFEFSTVWGLYSKHIKQSRTYEDTITEHIVLTQNDGDNLYDEELWLFSRLDEHARRYSVGFFMDTDGLLRPVNEPAFCFFPTKEVTNLNFILHAPFLLTNSREGIRAGVPHNDEMIRRLAELSADALVHLRDIGIDSSSRLIDDNIVKIIPTDKEVFSVPSDKRKVSFLPFFEAIKGKFMKCAIIPSSDGYVESKNAYWAAVPQLAQVFSNEQLADITENARAQWVFVTLGRDEVQRNNKALFDYIDDLVRTNLNEDAIINGRSRSSYYNRYLGVHQTLENVKGITKEFIEKQPISWLHDFYKWLSETKHRTEIIEEKPIFLDQNGNAVAAFDEDGQHILFMPVKDVDGYTVVNSALLENKDTREFIESIGVKQPSLKDQIYNIILPLYHNEGAIDTDLHFLMFFNYYCKCSNDEVDEFIELIKEYEFLTFYKQGDERLYRGSASSMYIPTPELKAYFETKRDARFVALDEYKALVEPELEKRLIPFLVELGIKEEPSIYTRSIDYHSSDRKKHLPFPRSTQRVEWEEQVIDGCQEILEYIELFQDETKSVILWNCLLKIIETKCTRWKTIGSILQGTVYYFYYSNKTDYFESLDAILLKKKRWIKDVAGNFVVPNNLYRDSIADIYDTTSEYAVQLMDFLGVQEKDFSEYDSDGDDSNLTPEQREKIAFANKLKAYGIENDEDLEEFREYKRLKEAQKRAAELSQAGPTGIESASHTFGEGDEDDRFDDGDSDIEQAQNESRTLTERWSINKTTSNVIKDIARRTKDKPVAAPASKPDNNDDADEDEYMPSVVDYSEKIERAKQKSAAEIDRIAYFEELQNKALRAQRYSYAWFTTLLEMESINSGEANTRSREVSISFAKVEREPNTKRTLVLKHPNRYIPQFMEELADIPMVLHMGDQKKTIAIEVANIQSYTLRVKMKSAEDISGIDLSLVTSVTIDAKSPAFLLEELRKQFNELGYEPDFDMQNNLCENIEFVFGPPGTGKTTHLAKNVLFPLMQKQRECKVLVLTPTNKSADVLVHRIMEVGDQDKSYNNWLVRFGTTGDEEIEQSPVYRDKTFDIRTLSKNVTVTTIARFPYDFFMPQGARVFLSGINWDYIVIDEASMIPLANIIFPLYKKTPKKFIIAGDPFQIEPIASVDLWKNENIYTMVHLDSFENPNTVPYQYKVELLTTQYRSVPDIGDIFSSFAYGGILKHYRSAESQRPLNIGNDLGIETLNIIKFPVSKYESIYRCKRLQHSSSYQVYSAIFTFEYVSYLSRAIAEKNPGEFFKVGIIAPYRAQADIIDKLFAYEKLPNEVSVQVGTIHGFQGDECDIIFAVFNTPPTISASKEMFLNKKNIINVSISRARDYLFVIMPDEYTENVNNLRLVKRVETLIQSTDAWNEFLSPDLEELMFGDSHYIENNAFSTSHQSVNVYGLPEKMYEVRTEDSAVDVQIHRTVIRTLEKVNSYDLDESLIPKNLQKMAIDLPVKGAVNGWCYLVPYEGKLKTHTTKKGTAMYIPQRRNGQEKMVSVSVVEEDRIIYISNNMFKLYEQGLSEPEGIELRRTFGE